MKLRRKRPLGDSSHAEVARAALRERIEECSETTRAEVHNRLGDIRTRDRMESQALDENTVMGLIRVVAQEERSSKGQWRTKCRFLTGVCEIAYAVKRSNGDVAWDVARVVDAAPGFLIQPIDIPEWGRLLLRGRWADERERWSPWDLRRWTTAKRRPIAKRCRCTPKDLVAIDALLEAGSKEAERLAKACRRGGAVLEGRTTKRHQRNGE